MSTLKRKLLRSGCGIGLLAVPVIALAQETPVAETPTTATTTSEVITLEEFILRESSGEALDAILPAERPVGGAFLGDVSALELPRSATILSMKDMQEMSIDGFEDIDRAGAGLSRPNIFGIPGLPFIRGDNASVFFNGMMRIANQNETPTSFGSFESFEIHKGPAPAHFGITNAGGYVATIPKTPYFDKQRGSFEFTLGEYDKYKGQLDVGGPMEFLGKPMAYRVSVTQQQSESYYNQIKNDYTSVYGAIKGQLTPKLTFFTGGEYYSFKSNENAGWNRVTQDLIDNNNYIIGDADPNLIAATGPYAGFADVSTFGAFFPDQNQAVLGGYNPDLALVVRAADFQSVFGAPTGPGGTYLAGPAAQMSVVNVGGSLYGYKYTPGYFGAGGTALTRKINGNTVLADRNDFANSQIGVWFGDLVWTGDNRTITLKSLVESTETEKFSSYGFAHDSEGYAINEKFLIEEQHDFGPIPMAFQYGIEWRRTVVNDAVDFFYEPFSRRDISASGAIIPASIVLAGPGIGWPIVAGDESRSDQYGIFLQTKADFTKYFTVYAGIRHELTTFSRRGPRENAARGPAVEGDEEYQNYSINPVVKVTDWWSIYGAAQAGTSLAPGQTGGIGQASNFIEAPFYEAGTKFALLNKKLFLTASVYKFEKTVLSETIIGSGESSYESIGYELELSYKPTRNFALMASLGEQESTYLGGFPFTTAPLSAEDVALTSGAIQYDVVSPQSVRYANNPEKVRQGYPLLTANLFATYAFDNGFGAGFGPQYKADFYNDNEKTIKLPSALVWNANLFYRGDKWEVFLRLNNVTDDDYFIGSSFAPTMIVTKAEPFNWEVSVKYKF